MFAIEIEDVIPSANQGLGPVNYVIACEVRCYFHYSNGSAL